MTISRILLGADESAAAAAAADLAAGLARGHQAQLDAVEPLASEGGELPPEVAAEQEEALRTRVHQWLEAHGDLTGRTVVASVAGDAAHVVPLYAEDHDVDVVVIGAERGGGVTKLGLGSLASSLAHRLRDPLVVVPPDARTGPIDTVVVGVDGSDGSVQALRWAEMLADPLDASVVAVYVGTGDSETPVRHGPLQDAIAAGHIEAADLVERVGTDVAAELGAEARDRGAGLVVVAAKTRGSLGGTRLGSVPDTLLHDLPVAVAVLPYARVHPDEFTSA